MVQLAHCVYPIDRGRNSHACVALRQTLVQATSSRRCRRRGSPGSSTWSASTSPGTRSPAGPGPACASPGRTRPPLRSPVSTTTTREWTTCDRRPQHGAVAATSDTHDSLRTGSLRLLHIEAQVWQSGASVASASEAQATMQSLAWEQCSDEGACLVTVHDV